MESRDDLAVEVSKGPDGELGRLAVILGALESRYAMGEPFAGSSERAADRGRFLDWLKGLRAFEESEDQAPVWLQNLLGRIDAFEAWLSRHESPRRALELSTRALARQPKDARMWDVRIQVGERLGEDISSWVLEAAQHTGEPRFRERARKLARGHGTSFVPFTGMVEGRRPSSLARGG